MLRLLPPKAPDVVDAPEVAPPPPKSPAPGLLAGVLDAPPPKRLELLVFAPPPNSDEPPDEPAPDVAVFAVPKSDGAEPPDVLLAAPNNGLLDVLPLFCCPKLKPDILCGCVGGGVEVMLWRLRAGAVYAQIVRAMRCW